MLKKQLIMQNALELFAAQGIEATSVQQITDKSGISKGAFYLSFKSKDELIIAIIHYFMTDLLTNIDSMVTKATNTQDLLYQYFILVYTNFNEHASFAKVLLNDLPKTLNESLMEHLMHYDRLITTKLHDIITKQFPNVAAHMINDTVFFTRGIVGMYGELFLHAPTIPDNLHTFCKALVEKVTIQATHATMPIVDRVLHLHPFHEQAISKEQTIHMLQELLHELQNDLLTETIILLIEQLKAPTLPSALLQGLINTMSLHAETKWLSVLLRCQFQLHEKS